MKPVEKIMQAITAPSERREKITKIIMDGVFYQKLLSECGSDISKIYLLNTHADEFMGVPIELKDIDVDFEVITDEVTSNPIEKITKALVDLVRENKKPTKIVMSIDFYTEMGLSLSPGLYPKVSEKGEELLGLPLEKDCNLNEDFRIETEEDTLSSCRHTPPTHPSFFDCNASNCRSKSLLDCMGSSVDSYKDWLKSRLMYRS